MKQIAIILIFFVLLTLFFSSCTSMDYYETETYRKPVFEPIYVDTENTPPIVFKKVLIQIHPGTKIGAHHDGLLKLSQFSYRWQTSTIIGSDQFNQVVNEELSNVGYNVVGSTTTLFDTDDAEKAHFLIGARIIDIMYNTYAPLAGNYSESRVTTEWELMDKSKRKIVFQKTTIGSSKLDGDTGTAVTFAAFRNATRKLLADKSFVETIVPKTKVVVHSKSEETIYIKGIMLKPYPDIKDLVKRAIESVVTLKTESGHASGVIISDNGYVITNYHAVEGQHFIDVLFYNGFILRAEVIKTDPDYDLALLKIDGSGFKPLPIGGSDNLQIAEEVYAIGTPALVELGQSVTRGIVSGRRIVGDLEYIQTDVAINPGNSGGPLINLKGNVIGIVTLKMVGTELEGIGFCIPINVAIDQLGLVYR